MSERKGADSGDPESWFEWRSALLAALFFLFAWLGSIYSDLSKKADFQFSITIAVLSYIGGVQFARLRRFKELERKLADISAFQKQVVGSTAEQVRR